MRDRYLEKIDHHTQESPFSIHHTVVPEDNTNALYVHYHPETEIFYLKKGSIRFFVEDKEYELHEGDAMFIPPFLVHNAVKSNVETCEYSAIVFSEKWLLEGMGTEGHLYLQTLYANRYQCVVNMDHRDERFREILGYLLRIENYRELPLTAYELRMRGELLIVFQVLYNLYFQENLDKVGKGDTQLGIQKSIDYMHAHLEEDITLEKLAEVSEYSISHYGHQFKKHTGYTPFAYLNRIRVIKVAEQLHKKGVSISRLAGECGFNNISYFNRMFEREFGMSPSQYRNKNQQGSHGKT